MEEEQHLATDKTNENMEKEKYFFSFPSFRLLRQ
jgi:hypothetical protein